ncbi:MAG: enoyl-CoA hydratase [Frankiales bacterium]|nr:enoyl-CoA hydratase [Frankiales bacterium]
MTAETGPALDSAAGFRLLLSEAQDVATIVLDEPQRRNAQSPHTWRGLIAAVNGLPGSVRVLMIRAEGPSFSAGLDRSLLSASDGDISELADIARGSASEADRAIAEFQQAFGLAARPSLVSIALVQGYAIGAGFQLALSCDIRIVSDDVQFSMAEVTLGLVPDLGGTKRLVELVGYSRAASICLTGRRITAAEADAIGLASAVVPVDQLITAGEQFAEQILAMPRSAVIETKALLLAAAGRSQLEQEAAERAAQYRQLRELVGVDTEDFDA